VWEESRNSVLGIILTVLSTVMQSIQVRRGTGRGRGSLTRCTVTNPTTLVLP